MALRNGLVVCLAVTPVSRATTEKAFQRFLATRKSKLTERWICTQAWLGRYISNYEGTVVIVTHEESLLNSAGLTGVIEVRSREMNITYVS